MTARWTLFASMKAATLESRDNGRRTADGMTLRQEGTSRSFRNGILLAGVRGGETAFLKREDRNRGD